MRGDGRRLDDYCRNLLRTMLIGVVGGRIVGVLFRMGLVALGGVGVMSSLFVVSGLMLLRGMLVLLTRFLVLLGGFLVRFSGFLRHRSASFQGETLLA
jgi:hypothetical protein